MSVTINAISETGVGNALGTVMAEDSKDGLVLNTDLKGLATGEHGFHVHEHGNCAHQSKDGKDDRRLSAGGPTTPEDWQACRADGQGHLGDLPKLVADKDGSAKARLVAPR